MAKLIKFIFIFVFILITFTPRCFAQKQDIQEDQVSFKTMHIFNLKPKYTADDLQIVLGKFNDLFIKLGHPECQYRLWENSEEKKQTRYLWESSWSSKSVYDEIHKNEEYRKLIRKDFIGLRKMFQDHTYFKYHELPFSDAQRPK
jgi:hypothetical protein